MHEDEVKARVARARHAAQKAAEWAKKRDEAVVDAYANGEGASPAAIAKAVERTDQAVRDTLRRMGVTLRGRGRPPAGKATDA